MGEYKIITYCCRTVILLFCVVLSACNSRYVNRPSAFDNIELLKQVTEGSAELIIQGNIKKSNPVYLDLQTISWYGR